MPVTKTEVNVAQEVINVLLGDKGEAQAYSENPEGWLDSHGYADVSAEALATCGVGAGGGGAGASASASAAVAPPVGAGAVAQLDYIVYNNYYEDNSITNNIENHGNLDFDQTVQNVEGDGNVVAGDDIEDSNVQTGDGIQVDEGTLVNTGNIETGEGDQLVDQSTNVTEAAPQEAPPEEAPEEPAEPIL